MEAAPFRLTADDGGALYVHRWTPALPPRAVVQIAHGLAEHGGRYAGLAQALTASGYAVYANDHRGHGLTAATPEDVGFFAARAGWRTCLDDLWSLHRRIRTDFPGAKIIMLGHSMGSFMTQDFIVAHSGDLAGAILSGSNGAPPAIAGLGRLVARIERLRLGARGKSALLRKMMFGEFNRRFSPARTPFDWLSRDSAEVDAYIADPLCGQDFSTQLAIDLIDALKPLTRPDRLARIAKDLPIYVMSGDRDPVGVNLAGLIEAYRRAGLSAVTPRIYPEGRHEMLHETNREQATQDLLAWLATLSDKA